MEVYSQNFQLEVLIKSLFLVSKQAQLYSKTPIFQVGLGLQNPGKNHEPERLHSSSRSKPSIIRVNNL